MTINQIKNKTQTPDLKPPAIIKRLAISVAGLSALLALVAIVSLAMGQGDVPLRTVLQSIVVKIGLVSPSTYPVDSDIELILWGIRLPRIVLAILVGMLLAGAGVALQGLLLNPLADPYIIGVSSGAALGASIGAVFGLASAFYGFGVPVIAFVTATGAMVVVYSLAQFRGRLAMHSFLLAGVVVGSFLWALLTFVMTIAGEDLSTIIYWLLGSFSAPDPWGYVRIALPFAVLALGGLYAFSRDLNVFSMGEETASHLGVRTESLKKIVIGITSLATAAAVSVSGIIGFVGLIVPHIARRMFGPDHRILLPTAALLGASLMVAADTVARNLVQGAELPVGVVTALLGAPFFCYLLKRGG